MSIKMDEFLYTKASTLAPVVLAKLVAVTMFLRKGHSADGTCTEVERERIKDLFTVIYPERPTDVDDACMVLLEAYRTVCANYKHGVCDPLAKHNLIEGRSKSMGVLDGFTADQINDLVFYVDALIDERDDVSENLSIVGQLEELGL